jgi:cytochrome b
VAFSIYKQGKATYKDTHSNIHIESSMSDSTDTKLLPVWNLHTRIFHIAIAIVTLVALTLGIMGDSDLMVWHYRCGYLLLGLIGFRLVTGILGGDYARFSRFPVNPFQIKTYLQGKSYAGHNPFGVWMVIFLLLAIAVQAISGLFTSDGFWLEGPWASDVNEQTVRIASTIHKNGQIVFFVLIGLHITGNIFTAIWKKQKSISAMLTGKKILPENSQWPAAKKTSWWVIAIALLAGAALSWIASNP